MLRVTPIYGSRWSPQGQAEEPSCTLVEYAGVRILWNCGYRPDFPASLPEHDAVIISDSSLAAAGGLPQYYHYMMTAKREQQQHQLEHESGEGTLDTPSAFSLPKIYATFPTVKMGQMTLYDLHASICLDGGRPAFSLQDIDNAFSSIHSIKYSQPISVMSAASASPSTRDPLSTISIVAHRAGHLVGACFFNLHRFRDETLVVLTTSRYQIAKELHLDGSTLLQDGSSPDVLVCSPGGVAMRYLRTLAHTTNTGARTTTTSSSSSSLLPTLLVSQAERNVTEMVVTTLRREGNVLLPVDAAGRVLEVVLLMNRYWDRHKFQGTYNLVWFAPMVYNTMEYAKSQLEWMASQLGTEFDSMTAGHPYQLRAVQVCTSMRQLEQVMSNQLPTCVMASGLSLEGGPARDVFLKMAENPDNAFVFTDSSQCYLRSTWYGTAVSGDSDQVMTDLTITPLPSSMTTSSAVSAPIPIEMDMEDADQDAAGGVGQRTLIGDAVEQPSEWTTAGQLLTAWAQAKLEGREMEDTIAIDVKVPRRVPLAGEELKSFLASEEKARQLHFQQEEATAMLREIELAKGELHLGEQEAAGSTLIEPATTTKSSRPRKKSRFDSALFLKFSKPLHLSFELRDEPAGIGQDEPTSKFGIGESMGRTAEILEDDYGIAVVPEHFTDIVSGVDSSKFGGTGRIGDEVLRRGLGYGVDGKTSKGKVSTGASGTRVSEDVDEDDIDDLDEDALEAVDLSEGNGIIRGRNGRPPSKVAAVIRKIDVQAEISFVPLEGRVDARAARQSVRALQPRRVIILGGQNSAEKDDQLVDEVSLLADAVKSFVMDDRPVLVPSDSGSVELDIGHAAYAVRVIDTPFQSRDERMAGALPPHVPEPYEAKLGACTVSLLDSIATGQKVAADGSIVLAPRAKLIEETPSLYLSDGEILLTDLRAELIAAGMKADYSTDHGYAQLIINQKIIVKKATNSGSFGVEGPLCEDFYTVRAFVCRQFVTL